MVWGRTLQQTIECRPFSNVLPQSKAFIYKMNVGISEILITWLSIHNQVSIIHFTWTSFLLLSTTDVLSYRFNSLSTSTLDFNLQRWLQSCTQTKKKKKSACEYHFNASKLKQLTNELIIPRHNPFRPRLEFSTHTYSRIKKKFLWIPLQRIKITANKEKWSHHILTQHQNLRIELRRSE